ncbi:PAS domain-containing protein, partial [Deinococcus aerolatus]
MNFQQPSALEPYLMSHALEACVTGVVIADARQGDYPVVYVNPAFEQLSGYLAAEIIGRNCRFLQGDDRDQEARQDLREAMAHGRTITTVLRNYRKDGSMFYNELALSPIHDAAGLLTHYLGFQTDVTAREEARQAEVKAREQMATTLNRVTDGLMSFDPD